MKNEAQRLPAALESVAFCDEVVVVDSGSTDGTLEIARAAGAKVIEQPWLGYGGQRNVALDHATCDWVLEIDADERITPELQQEIRRFLEDPPAGYEMCGLPQFHRFLGAELRPSMKYPNYRSRVFRRGVYRHDESRTVHEGLWPKGPVWPFAHDMSHELAGSWREALRDTWAYARLEASALPAAGSARDAIVGIFVRPLAKFAYRLVIDGGWRDGWRGTARIALDCAHDVCVWISRTLQRPKERAVEGSANGHFAAGRPSGWGTPLVIGVASGKGASERAASWLEQAAAAGVDVSLVTDAPPRDGSVRVRRLDHFGPLLLARALDAERQLRGQADALLVQGRAAERMTRLLPASIQGIESPIEAGESAAAAKLRLSRGHS